MHLGNFAGILSQPTISLDLQIIGTPVEDGSLTALGGTGFYTWTLVSDATVLGTGSTLTIPATAVGDEVRCDDGENNVDSAVVTSSAIGWLHSGDYAAGALVNRGYLGSQMSDGTTSPSAGTDTLGPYVDFTGADGLELDTAALIAYNTESDFTMYFLADSYDGSSDFIGEIYQTGARLGLRKSSGEVLQLLDSTYSSYAAATVGACELSTIVLDGARGLGFRYGYRDQLRPDDSGIRYNPRVFNGTVSLGFGGLNTGTSPYQGKVRFFAVYGGKHDAAKRAEVRAAMARSWAHLDHDLEDLGTVAVDLDPDDLTNLTKNGSDEILTMTDKSVNANAYYDNGAGPLKWVAGHSELFNGKAYIQTDNASDTELRCDVCDIGGDTADQSLLFVCMNDKAVNAGRWFHYNGLPSGYPQWRMTPTSCVWYPYTGTAGLVLSSNNSHVGYPQAFLTTSSATEATMSSTNGERVIQTPPNGPATIPNSDVSRVFGIGSNSPKGKVARMIWYRTKLTPTEQLLALAICYDQYGTGRDAIADVDARDATDTSGEATELIDRINGSVFAPDAGGTGPDFVADYFDTGMDGLLYDASLKSLVVEPADTTMHHPALQWTFFAVVDSDHTDDDSRIFGVDNLIIGDARTSDYHLTLYDLAFRDSTVVGTAGKQVLAFRNGDEVVDFFRNGVHEDQVANGTNQPWDATGGGMSLGCSTTPSLVRQFRGHLGKLIAYPFAMPDEDLLAKMAELQTDWDIP